MADIFDLYIYQVCLRVVEGVTQAFLANPEEVYFYLLSKIRLFISGFEFADDAVERGELGAISFQGGIQAQMFQHIGADGKGDPPDSFYE